jgi:hypothetical protein
MWYTKTLNFFKPCHHDRVYCIHGDAINDTARFWRHPQFALVRCYSCGRPVYGRARPPKCTDTGQLVHNKDLHHPHPWRKS